MTAPATCRTTGKRRFADETAARRALREIHKGPRASEPNHERRVYQCALCGGGWHLSSQPDVFKRRFDASAATAKSNASARRGARRAIAKIHNASKKKAA